jgi:hypothetical protein
MKSERRHELQQNSLIQAVHDLPELARRHGSRIALVVIAISLVIIWMKYRSNTAAQKLEDARVQLTEAMISLRQLQNLSVVPPGSDDPASQQRTLWYSDGLQHADDALDEAADGDAKIRAQALIYKGDINFTLADMPDLPGAATRPSLLPQMGKPVLLANAQAAYSHVLSDFADNSYAASAAHFGLAAVAEDVASGVGGNPDPTQWDVAKDQYQAILADPNAPQAYKDYANSRLTMLPTLQQRPAINVPPPGATRPALLGPVIEPTTR